MHFLPNYVQKIMSFRWHTSCWTHIWSLCSKSCIVRSNIFCGRAAISWWMESFICSIMHGLFMYTLHDRSGSSKCFNPLEYSVSIWNCTSTLYIELLTEKTTESLFLKELINGKHMILYILMCHGYWNCIVWAVCQLTPDIINPTLAEY
jgi:hypothetical protein